VENRLFATLDPRTRRLELAGGETVMCTDTVGFISRLPHQLVEAFHSTLEVVADSELLVHVVDASTADPGAHIAAVQSVLVEIEAAQVPQLLCFNKADLAPDAAKHLVAAHAGSVACSGLTGAGLDELLAAIALQLRIADRAVEFAVPYDRGDVVAALHRAGEVVDSRDENGCIHIRARLDEASRRRFEEFIVPAGLARAAGRETHR
jgi:GTP-binding protein HflX